MEVNTSLCSFLGPFLFKSAIKYPENLLVEKWLIENYYKDKQSIWRNKFAEWLVNQKLYLKELTKTSFVENWPYLVVRNLAEFSTCLMNTIICSIAGNYYQNKKEKRL